MHFRTVSDAETILLNDQFQHRELAISAESGVQALLHARAHKANTAFLKRSLDITVSGALLAFLAPSLILIGLLIRLESDGPALFHQKRFGRNGKVFTLMKFRSMKVQESDGAFVQARSADPRVTPLGRWLRRTSIDELPQLFNVLMGDMSLVGPRPHALAMDQHYARIVPNYLDRLLVRPGLTGLAQISGLRGPTNTIEDISMRVNRDRAYVRRWSFLLDLKILARTPLALFGPNAL
ncbi:sugar transferase [Hyphomicrobium facile]|uniref:Putative colanic acid biosysnthesis UDP-glucose lipid carrier transferase n=1 Tax=Hyphomicrobium facile TaxID=51670 RepID=A0A1I7N6D8_9HYPH|nr:sugar transferase [Hyphomicrobium facile]SFV30143.1 putative colanic acid biosysnthesis UDP-glucose lipid carrier transferase [Hyphomicrobium facile]